MLPSSMRGRGRAVSVCACSMAAWLGCALAVATAPGAVAADMHVTIDNFAFSPAVLTVPVGTKVIFDNKDDIPHTVVASDKAFRSPALDTDETFGVTLAKAGVIGYFCSLHPHMTGKIVVTP
jgi:plastocyanin